MTNNKTLNLPLLERSLMDQFRIFNASTLKLAEFISKELSDEAWNLLQTKHKGSSEAKAWSLVHMWAKNGDMKWEGMPEVDEHQIDSENGEIPRHKTNFSWELLQEKTIKETLVDPIVKIEEEYLKEVQQILKEDVILPKHKGLRFNTGKLRYDLVHPWSHEQMVRVLTKGSQKYAERNWEKGMAWSNVIASAKRHMAAIERGEDYDIDHNCPECQISTKDNWVCKNHTGELHAALLQTNAHFLTAYYKIYPQGDDRPKPYLSYKKIGLDIDDVLADFVGAWLERYPQNKPNFWNFDKDIKEKFQQVALDKDFWMSIKPKISPDELPFEPHCYITSRMIPNEWTEEWLQANGFPAVPVYTVGFNESKVEVAKESGIDIFVDDRFENFVELNNAGICTFLMDAAHNRRYDVQARRIFSLKDLM